MNHTTTVTDFGRSFVRWRLDTTKKPALTVSQPLPMTLNNVRAPLDARAVLTELATGREHDFALTVSCKAEQVCVERDVWHNPPADMCMIASREEFLVVKRWDKADKGVMRHPATLGQETPRTVTKGCSLCCEQTFVDAAREAGDRAKPVLVSGVAGRGGRGGGRQSRHPQVAHLPAPGGRPPVGKGRLLCRSAPPSTPSMPPRTANSAV